MTTATTIIGVVERTRPGGRVAVPARERDSGRFIPSQATRNVRHDMFSTSRAESIWLAGLLAADGCISQDGRRWSLSQSGEEGRLRIDHVCRLINYGNVISVRQPPAGKLAYSISVTSPRMVADLAGRYGVLPARSLTYRWPGIDSSAATFLRGYIEGDGCVGEYRTPSGTPFLHISYVGTPEFVDGALAASPTGARVVRLAKCKNLAEVRYSGRYAWRFGEWAFAERALYESAKVRKYRSHVGSAQPKWLKDERVRSAGRALLIQGVSPEDVSAELGVHWRTVYRWKKAMS